MPNQPVPTHENKIWDKNERNFLINASKWITSTCIQVVSLFLQAFKVLMDVTYLKSLQEYKAFVYAYACNL